MKLNREQYHDLWKDSYDKYTRLVATNPHLSEAFYYKGVLDALTWMKEHNENKGEENDKEM